MIIGEIGVLRIEEKFFETMSKGIPEANCFKSVSLEEMNYEVMNTNNEAKGLEKGIEETSFEAMYKMNNEVNCNESI